MTNARAPGRPERLATREAYRRGYFGVFEHDVALRSGGQRTVVTLDLPDCCTVAAVTPEGRFVLVRQHRHGVDAITIETAGGVVDDGEDPAASAARELVEETGYAADRLDPLGWVHTNPPISPARAFLYLARNARRVGAPVDDEREETEPLLLDGADVARAIEDGRASHQLTVLVLTRALARLESERARAAEGAALEQVLGLLERMEAHAHEKVVALARRLRPGLTAEDLRNPHDFPDLDDPDWHFEDGQLAGIQAVRFAVRALVRERVGDGEQEEGRAEGGA
jgi:8-oxo-dGTP pyrophosphatase MutT (NUDIX family)